MYMNVLCVPRPVIPITIKIYNMIYRSRNQLASILLHLEWFD